MVSDILAGLASLYPLVTVNVGSVKMKNFFLKEFLPIVVRDASDSTKSGFQDSSYCAVIA